MPQYDPYKYTYPSRRNVVFAKNGMACTSVPLGAQVGLEVLKAGGNAMDAAVAMAAGMPLFEPTGNGLGSDAFALVWVEGEKKLYGLNASGVAPAGLSAELVKGMGFSEMPREGWLPTMVPGAPAGWAELNRRFGSKPLTELFAPAVRYARQGVPVPVNVARQWAKDARRLKQAMEENPAPHAWWRQSFLKEDGSPYEAGDLFRWEEYAATLEELAATGCESYYRGALMEKILAFSRETGGYFSEDDFRSYHPEWVEPITVNYRGYTVCEIPPNGHGITVLMALNILNGLEFSQNRESADTYHKMMEAIKLAFADTKTYVADPRYMKTRVEDLLSEEYAARRRALITDRALLPQAGAPSCGGTIYLCTADSQGNMVSWIQSNYTTFGAGVAVPGTGISFQNRGANFSLDPNSDNCLAGGKKSYHTIIPGFLMKDGEAVGPFGVMGAFMQPQGHVEVLVNTIDYHMNPQEALDAPRVQWIGGKHIQLEREISPEIAKALAAMGHEVEVIDDPIDMGRGQIIWRTDNGLLIGGTEPRCDGTVAAW
ncbi:gamma-glutamyltransferase family protein [Pseudoflavonifractor sp. 60]|uniref:gamma-glutamyltransferase family protein n=1 Tax=Pseudoflavonifractor sp. 60 TaxID=2304576 RepID=UPI00136A54A2|nr:gamma-glutamyltransferase family protein [Pseudoflavonifractor sp. 60]NBI66168.1 gamma-glutamyltransferase family protein [Pseudoflavonifractor sp. 60]